LSNLLNFDSTERRLIPWWSVLLSVAAFALVQYLIYAVMLPNDRHHRPLAVVAFWGITVGMFFAFHMLMIGYVTRDAKRRGMNPLLWILVLIALMPAGVGFIVYFMLRQPLVLTCPKCTRQVEARFNFCPRCQHQLNPVCPECRHGVTPGDAFCANCGNSLVLERIPVRF